MSGRISAQATLTSIGIGLFVFALIWVYIITPEITKMPENFSFYAEQIGENSIAPKYGAPLPEPFKHFNTHELKAIHATNDVLEISSRLQATNMDTGVKFLDESKVYEVNRYTRANTARDMGYFFFPQDTQQHDYFLTFPLGFTNAVFSYEGRDVISGLEVYRFSCKSQPYDITNAIPQFRPYKVLSFYSCVIWIEPVTGKHVDFLLQWESYYDENGQLTYLAEKGYKRTTASISAQLVDKVKEEKLFLQMIKYATPITLGLGGVAMLSFARLVLSKKTRHLEKINIELKEIEKAKSEFISMMSHELRNPLQAIIVYSEALLGENAADKMTAEQKNTIGAIYKSAAKIDRLINDLQDMQKLELGQLKIFPSYVDVADLINHNIMELRLLADDKQVEIQSDIRASGTVYCDKSRIGQVLTNLIKNSIDFVPEMGGKITIRVENEGQSKVLFTIEDNGIGISADKISKLFHKFYQVDSSLPRKHGGSGLGLAICKGIIEQHGGSIWLDKTYSKGTAIRFTLPRRFKDEPVYFKNINDRTMPFTQD